MENPEIENLLLESTGPCVSVIVPLHRLSPERAEDSKSVKIAVGYAKELLKQKYAQHKYDRVVSKMTEDLDSIINRIDFTHSKDGLGIYMTPGVTKIIEFPFEVTEKIKVRDSLDSRDLLYDLNVMIEYCVLSISKKHIRLFKGKGEELREIKNENFPINYEESYEYSRSARGNSFGNTLKDFEKDKSVLQEIRLVDFLRTADHLLDKYVNSKVPLIISGGKKEIADYLQITKYKKRIIGKVMGNYNFNGDLQLINLAWMEVQNYLNNQNKNVLANLRELTGKEMVAVGIKEVWEAANEGKGLELVIEKDFESHAFMTPDGYDLKLRKPIGKTKHIYVPDIVERIIKVVREKHGKVTFVGNGEMNNFDGIALLLRYNNNPNKFFN
ncbi:MAG: baeRF3 domain-containing protein [Bacteroidia bacterium]